MEVALKRIADAVRRTRGGVVSSAIEARSIPGMGVGIVAREYIPKDTLVFQAGQEVWYPFSAEHALETAQQKAPGFLNQLNQLLASNRALREGSSFVPSALVLGVHMLVNFPHAEDPETTLMAMASMDTPLLDELYVNALPRCVDLPLYWNEKQFEELQGCEEARRAMQHGARFYSQVYRHLFGANNQFVNPEAFFWAISILMSRATSGQNQPFALIPVFDWFNHADNGDECVQEFDSQKGFMVHTVKSYEPGEQLFINYGNHGNLRLLRNYGFTIPSNPYDTVNLPMPASLRQPNEADPAFSQKRDLLLSATGSQVAMPVLNSLRFAYDGSLAQNEEQWLEIMLATPDELNEIFKEAASQGSLNAGPTATSLRSPSSLTQKVRSEVGKVVASRLKQHASSFEEDDVFLRANEQQMAPWLRSCLHIRMGEKQALLRAASKYA
ncbi:Histone-lysine N-methyltransferase setd3 [Phytophthora cinnamomi]|uniref:Histone-lysine N-methyltransferase setd3 n=1 Tax=Phytophthora cinnamomi TaxID=4785 RepID=UPI003559610F|nr:Histone-lysine N-methyltransferase setd3 [Phytophthora cinnamomi]